MLTSLDILHVKSSGMSDNLESSVSTWSLKSTISVQALRVKSESAAPIIDADLLIFEIMFMFWIFY